MMVPSNRLLWLIAITILPAAAICGLVPASAWICVAVVAAVGITVAVDAVRSVGLLDAVRVTLPELVRMTLDRETEIPLRVENGPARLTLGLAMPAEFGVKEETLAVAIPSALAQVPWLVTPMKRGSYRIDRCYFESDSRLRLWLVRGSCAANCELRVYPNLKQDARQVAVFLNRGGAGSHVRRIIGKGRDFEKLREYEHGDTFDEIHWKTTAKRGRPVTKVFQVEKTQEVYVAIDSSRLLAREDILERYVNAALMLGAVCEQEGDLFGLVTFCDKVTGFVRARNGKSHYGACREALYTLQPRLVSPDFDELGAFLRTRLRRRALVIVLTALDDPALAEAFVRNIALVKRKHVVLVAMAAAGGVEPLFTHGDVNSEDDVYAALGGHLAWRKLKELERVLGQHGVRLLMLDPAKISAQVTSAYRSVKQRQLL